jgi:hypothetical protein
MPDVDAALMLKSMRSNVLWLLPPVLRRVFRDRCIDHVNRFGSMLVCRAPIGSHGTSCIESRHRTDVTSARFRCGSLICRRGDSVSNQHMALA